MPIAETLGQTILCRDPSSLEDSGPEGGRQGFCRASCLPACPWDLIRCGRRL